ncbi:sterol desaturase family protein [Fodinibius salsisoli]|uniref:Sterol desaturase family protein n=1 Tax=Fodinibius salsisoli TaxID=2820877 RepID=A0ABT3PRC9_9BACT|nr:sterol desaturase family protein [Fodinibius salsisoli]MCW9708423.1 sterol desaturase family protein [Fodinibius salsisoli]
MQALINVMEQTQVAAAAIGLILLMLLEQAHPFFDFFKGSIRKKGKHLAANMALGLTNALLISVFFVGTWLWASNWAYQNQFGLLNWLAIAGLPAWGHTVGAVLLMDLWMYLWHLINHKIPFLWRFHRVHHADPNMDVTTASRFHTGEIVFSSLLRIGVLLLTGIYLWELLLYETLMFAVVQLHHANIALPPNVDKVLRTIIVTPAMHKVHHSRWQPETDSNYSSLFSFWDRLCQTFRLHDPLSSLRIGLDEFDTPEDHKVQGLFTMPFRKGTRRPPEESNQEL